MKKILKILIFVLFCSFFIPINSVKTETKNIVVDNIEIRNNERIDSETIISYLNIEKGDSVNYEILNSKLKNMYKLGLFADIKFRIIQNNLIVIIKENPVINNITFSGNKKIKDENIIMDTTLVRST